MLNITSTRVGPTTGIKWRQITTNNLFMLGQQKYWSLIKKETSYIAVCWMIFRIVSLLHPAFTKTLVVSMEQILNLLIDRLTPTSLNWKYHRSIFSWLSMSTIIYLSCAGLGNSASNYYQNNLNKFKSCVLPIDIILTM